MAEPTLDARQKRALADALLACPSMADRAGRDAIIRDLPGDIQHHITRSDVGLLDVTSTINAALNYPRGLATLVELVQLFEGDSLPMAEVDRVLAGLGRPSAVVAQSEPAVGPYGDRWALKSPVEMEFVRITAGEFLMGSDPDLDGLAEDEERPQHHVYLPEYYIGRYPVTVAQYRAFAQASHREMRGPQGGPDCPVIWVTWDDVQVFCRWLSQRSGFSIRLPSEAEWEKAARGTDGRCYPWGDDAPNATRGTFDPCLYVVLPVGLFPAGASPYGVLDMASNIWEWTASLITPYPYRADDGRNDPEGKGGRVLRGGSWDGDQRATRCARRIGYWPSNAFCNIGFRVVVSLSSSGF